MPHHLLVGAGPVTGDTTDGSAAPGNLATTNEVHLTVGGKTATVLYSGLTPALVGLYQVNAVVPDGVIPGDAIVVTLTVADQSSMPAILAVQ